VPSSDVCRGRSRPGYLSQVGPAAHAVDRVGTSRQEEHLLHLNSTFVTTPLPQATPVLQTLAS